MELHRNTMALEVFWIVGSGKIIVRWNYIVLRWYANAEKNRSYFWAWFCSFLWGILSL